MSSGPVVIAHRGDPVNHVENTLAAIDRAIKDGSSVIEIDIRLTADGQVVVVHDPTLLRIFGLDRPVAELSLAQIRELRAPDGSIVPTLQEALEIVSGRASLLVDMTDAQFAAPAVAAVAAFEGAENTSWCGDAEALQMVRQKLPTAEIYLTMNDENPPTTAMLDLIEPQWINPWFGVVTSEYVQAITALGLGLCCWTVDEADDAQRVAELGVERIISNRAPQIRAHLKEHAAS